MPARSIRRGAALVGDATATAAPFYVDSDDNKLKFVPAGSGTTEVEIVDASSAQTLSNKTFTSPVLTAPTGTIPAEVVAATNIILAAESGKTFFLNHATEFVSTLPAPALGLFFRFIVTGAPSGASYTVVTAGAPDQVMIGRVFLSAGSGADGDTEDTAGGTTLTFVDGAAVIGDMAEFWSDGTNWYVTAHAKVSTGITITG